MSAENVFLWATVNRLPNRPARTVVQRLLIWSSLVALTGIGARILVMDGAEMENDLARKATEVMTSLCARRYGPRSAGRRAERAALAAAGIRTGNDYDLRDPGLTGSGPGPRRR